MTYTRDMSENAMPLPYEVQEMTTTEARKHLPELVNVAAYGHVTTVLTRDGRRLARIVPEEDAWVYSPAWQEKLQEAEADLAPGGSGDSTAMKCSWDTWKPSTMRPVGEIPDHGRIRS